MSSAARSTASRDAGICALGVTDLGRLYRRRELSPVEVVQATLERIERLNPELNAYLAVFADAAMAAARAAELQFGAGIELGPMQGIPFSIKDNINALGSRTTAASRVLEAAAPDERDAAVVHHLRRAGAILLGKVNLWEFAFGQPGPDSPFGDVRNPRHEGHQTGGSSSGSGAAVAAGLGVISLGTDTGGSVRHPASVCGVVGLTQTYGLVPIRGVIPVSVYLDRVGPLGRSVADVAAALGAMEGYDPHDPYSILAPQQEYMGALELDVRGMRLGVPTNPFYQFGLPEALSLVERARSVLLELGLSPVPLELPRAEETNGIADTLMTVDAWVYHRRHRGQEALYGRNLLERLGLAERISAAEYAEARLHQADIRRQWLALFERADVLVLPANAAGAPPIGQDTIDVDGEPYLARTVTSRFTRAASLVGFPALVMPVGATLAGLPVGIQLVGPPFGESRLFAVGSALERALGNLPAQWGIEPRPAQ